MTTHTIAQSIQLREGWADKTLQTLLLDYIESQEANEAFENYLNDRAYRPEQDDVDLNEQTG